MDQKLTFSEHINAIVSKGNRALGLLIRTLQSAPRRGRFNLKATLAAYGANVRSGLEYCSVVWAGAARCHLVRLERIQHRFLMWLCHKVDGNDQCLEYQSLLNRFKLCSPNARRVQPDLLFMYKVFNGFIDSSYLLQSFYLHVPSRSTRRSQHSPFFTPRGRVNTIVGSIFVRGPRSFNLFADSVRTADVFSDPIGRLKKKVMEYSRTLPIYVQ